MSIFVKKTEPENQLAGHTIVNLIGLSPKVGDIGIEIEVEGNKFPKDSETSLIPLAWKYTHDGSLRGEDNAEYVLKKPLKFEQVPDALNKLWSMFNDYGSVLSESNRTSVHVHLNVQNFHLNRLCSFVAMYFAMEDLLTAWCGDHRVGNLFCLRATDAPAIVRRMKDFFQCDGIGYQFSSGMHYAGLNPSAIHKFGSIEIRSLRGVTDPQVIIDWVSVLERLYKLSEDFKDPRDVVAGFSGAGPIAWLQNLLGDKYSTIMDNVPFNVEEVRGILYRGIRLAQDLCYCRDWSSFQEKTLEKDPFNRPQTAAKVIPSPTVSFSSTYFVTSPLSEHTQHIIENLYVEGNINSDLKSELLGASESIAKHWLVSNGYWYDPEPEEDDEDVFDEDDYDWGDE